MVNDIMGKQATNDKIISLERQRKPRDLMTHRFSEQEEGDSERQVSAPAVECHHEVLRLDINSIEAFLHALGVVVVTVHELVGRADQAQNRILHVLE